MKRIILLLALICLLVAPAWAAPLVKYANSFNTVLMGTVSTSATTIVIASATNFPSLTGAEYTILKVTRMSDLAVEYMKATAIAGTTVTVTRAQEGSSALAFIAADRVAGVVTKGVLDAISDYYATSDDTLALAIATATAAAQTAIENANAALAMVNSLIPLTATNIAAGSINSTHITNAIAGAGLSGGGGDNLSVNVDDSTIAIVSDYLQVKTGGLRNSHSSYSYLPEGGGIQPGKLVAFEEATAGPTTSSGFTFYTGSRPWTVFGNDSTGMQVVYLTFRNTSAAASCNIAVYIGYNLNYYTMTGTQTDLGDKVVDAVLPDTTVYGQEARFEYTILVPPGYRYLISHELNYVTATRTGTPELMTHRVHEWY